MAAAQNLLPPAPPTSRAFSDFVKTGHLLVLSPLSATYKKIAGDFLKTAKGYKITSICQVKTDAEILFNAYAQRKDRQLSKLPRNKTPGHQRSSSVKSLYHGAPAENLAVIIKSKFNRSYGSVYVYGKGAYFAVNASYSVDEGYAKPDSSHEQHMFVCDVVIGQYIKGSSSMTTAPKKFDLTDYANTVDDIKNPTIFVAWEDYQAIPRFLISFSKVAATGWAHGEPAATACQVEGATGYFPRVGDVAIAFNQSGSSETLLRVTSEVAAGFNSKWINNGEKAIVLQIRAMFVEVCAVKDKYQKGWMRTKNLKCLATPPLQVLSQVVQDATVM